MKKIILGLCLLSATTLMCASARAMDGPRATDELRVPVKVKAEFHHEYRHVSNVNWTMVDGRYDVSFRDDGKTDMLARYAWSGHRIDTREAVAQSAMPVKAVGHLEEKYPGAYTHAYTKIHRHFWKKDLYMVKVKDKAGYVPVYVDKNGHEHDYASR